MTTSEVAHAVNSLGTAFLTGDPDVVLNRFASTGEVVYAGSEPGEVAVGREAIRSLLEGLFGRAERYSWCTTSVSSVGTPDTLYVVVDANLFVHPVTDGSVKPAVEKFPYRISGVLERERAALRWRLCHGSEPAGG